MTVITIFLFRKGGLTYLTTKLRQQIDAISLNGDSYDYIFNPYYLHKSSQFEILAQTNQKIILLGDSITDEGEWVELLTNPHILNRGISGDTTVRVYKRLAAIIQVQPRQLFLLIGINDLINTNKSILEIVRDYRQLVSELTAKLPKTEIFLQSVLPVNNSFSTFLQPPENILTLNQNIQAIATEFQCTYIDIYSHLANSHNQLDQKYTNDGVHLNGQAYMIWAEILKKYIQDIGSCFEQSLY